MLLKLAPRKTTFYITLYWKGGKTINKKERVVDRVVYQKGNPIKICF